jgi:hypothetical protein
MLMTKKNKLPELGIEPGTLVFELLAGLAAPTLQAFNDRKNVTK